MENNLILSSNSRVALVPATSYAVLRFPFLRMFAALTVVGVLSFARRRLQDPAVGLHPALYVEILHWITCYYPWLLIAPGVFWLERRFPIGGPRWPQHFGVLTAAGLLVSYMEYQISVSIYQMAASLVGIPVVYSSPSLIVPWAELCTGLQFYWPIVLAGYSVRRFVESGERERQASALALTNAQLESDLKRAELDVLRMRLSPHFLFNTLQNVQVLIEHEPESASKMLTRLGDLLRAVIRRDNQPETALALEIELAKAYLDVESVRFGDRLSVTLDMDPGTTHALVPVLLLQPLVENAIKHGLRSLKGVGKIALRSIRKGDSLVLTVSDNGAGPPADCIENFSLGVGLGATRERLQRMYPRSHAFLVNKMDTGGTEVSITLPFRMAAAMTDSTAQ